MQRRESIRAIQLSSHSQLLAACIVVVGGVWTTTATTKGALVTAQRQLKEMQVQRQSAAEERDEMAARLADADGRMLAATAEHAEALRRLTQKTRQSISEVERIFDEISIDPARLVPRGSTTGRGRPSVKWSDRTGARGPTVIRQRCRRSGPRTPRCLDPAPTHHAACSAAQGFRGDQSLRGQNRPVQR